MQLFTSLGQLLRIRAGQGEINFGTATGIGTGEISLFTHIGQRANRIAPQLFNIKATDTALFRMGQGHHKHRLSIGFCIKNQMFEQPFILRIFSPVISLHLISCRLHSRQRLTHNFCRGTVLHNNLRLNTIAGHIGEKLKSGNTGTDRIN